MNIPLASAADTEALGERIGRALEGGCIVYLRGELGAGKTTLVRGLLRALGHTGPVRSPTYTLAEPYELSAGAVYHLDLYRLGDPEELEYIGLRDLLEPGAVVLVEWPERGGALLPAADLEVRLRYAGWSRACVLEAASARGQAVLGRL